MGDRVAVLRKGRLQQVDTPQTLYDDPVNQFVAGFIGSPSMNLFDATLVARGEGLAVEFGGSSIPVPAEVAAARPGLRAHVDGVVVLGIRPEHLEDAAFAPEATAEQRIRTSVDLRESLGSEVVVHCAIKAPPAMNEDARELASDIGVEATELTSDRARRGSTTILARLNPRTTARKGDAIELAVDTRCLQFFDPADGTSIGIGRPASG